MLRVAFAELMRRGAREVLAGEAGWACQRHHILQLIPAKAPPD
jgi:hypothetical protein